MNVNQLLKYREKVLSGKSKYYPKELRDGMGLWNIPEGPEKRKIIKDLHELTKKKNEHDKKTKNNSVQKVQSKSK